MVLGLATPQESFHETSQPALFLLGSLSKGGKFDVVEGQVEEERLAGQGLVVGRHRSQSHFV